MKTNCGLEKHRKRNNKAIRYAAVGRKNPNAGRYVIVTAVVLLVLFSAFFCLNDRFFKLEGMPTWADLFQSSEQMPIAEEISGDTAVHYIDVGQGDCQLIKSGKSAALIDCGEKDYFSQVINYIKSTGVERLDYVIITHPHSDHAGGMSYILDEFDIGTVIMPNLPDSMVPVTSTYTRLIKTIDRNEISLEYAEAGKEYPLGEGTFTLYSPLGDYENLNNYSVSARFVYKNSSFLFTGDIESEAETDILYSNADISADVLKVAHHGSSTSSQKAFLEAVNPKYAVIGVGSPNDYGHPDSKTLKRINNMDIIVYRTDMHGHTVFYTDGDYYKIVTQKES